MTELASLCNLNGPIALVLFNTYVLDINAMIVFNILPSIFLIKPMVQNAFVYILN